MCFSACAGGGFRQISVKTGGPGGFYNFDEAHTKGAADAVPAAEWRRIVRGVSGPVGLASNISCVRVKKGKNSVNPPCQGPDRRG